jgi:hypothetical protein
MSDKGSYGGSEKMVIKSILGAICTWLVVVSFNAYAIPVLESRLGGLAYYDPVADVTWLADANAAAGSGYDTSWLPGTGRMTWDDASAWVGNLNINGVTGWRLPDTSQLDASCSLQSSLQSDAESSGYNCTGSEMGNLFYNVLGGVAHTTISTTHNSNYDLFSNVQYGISYWSSVMMLDNYYAWLFSFYDGEQSGGGKSYSLYAWAVHSGNVSSVPEPPMMLLITTCLFGLIWKAKIKSV